MPGPETQAADDDQKTYYVVAGKMKLRDRASEWNPWAEPLLPLHALDLLENFNAVKGDGLRLFSSLEEARCYARVSAETEGDATHVDNQSLSGFPVYEIRLKPGVNPDALQANDQADNYYLFQQKELTAAELGLFPGVTQQEHTRNVGWFYLYRPAFKIVPLDWVADILRAFYSADSADSADSANGADGRWVSLSEPSPELELRQIKEHYFEQLWFHGFFGSAAIRRETVDVHTDSVRLLSFLIDKARANPDGAASRSLDAYPEALKRHLCLGSGPR